MLTVIFKECLCFHLSSAHGLTWKMAVQHMQVLVFHNRSCNSMLNGRIYLQEYKVVYIFGPLFSRTFQRETRGTKITKKMNERMEETRLMRQTVTWTSSKSYLMFLLICRIARSWWASAFHRFVTHEICSKYRIYSQFVNELFDNEVCKTSYINLKWRYMNPS
jgi:hypothetical protein